MAAPTPTLNVKIRTSFDPPHELDPQAWSGVWKPFRDRPFGWLRTQVEGGTEETLRKMVEEHLHDRVWSPRWDRPFIDRITERALAAAHDRGEVWNPLLDALSRLPRLSDPTHQKLSAQMVNAVRTVHSKAPISGPELPGDLRQPAVLHAWIDASIEPTCRRLGHTADYLLQSWWGCLVLAQRFMWSGLDSHPIVRSLFEVPLPRAAIRLRSRIGRRWYRVWRRAEPLLALAQQAQTRPSRLATLTTQLIDTHISGEENLLLKGILSPTPAAQARIRDSLAMGRARIPDEVLTWVVGLAHLSVDTRSAAVPGFDLEGPRIRDLVTTPGTDEAVALGLMRLRLPQVDMLLERLEKSDLPQAQAAALKAAREVAESARRGEPVRANRRTVFDILLRAAENVDDLLGAVTVMGRVLGFSIDLLSHPLANVEVHRVLVRQMNPRHPGLERTCRWLARWSDREDPEIRKAIRKHGGDAGRLALAYGLDDDLGELLEELTPSGLWEFAQRLEKGWEDLEIADPRKLRPLLLHKDERLRRAALMRLGGARPTRVPPKASKA